MTRYEKAFLNVMLWLIFTSILRTVDFVYGWEPASLIIIFVIAQICFIFLDKKKKD